MENQREKLRRLGYSPPEIESIISADRGEKLFELAPQQKKVEKEMRQAARTPTVYKFENRARKADEMKKCILSQLVKALEPNCDAPPEIVNSEREFTFFYSGKKYKVVLAGRPHFLKFPLDILMYLYYNKDIKRIKKGNDNK